MFYVPRSTFYFLLSTFYFLPNCSLPHAASLPSPRWCRIYFVFCRICFHLARRVLWHRQRVPILYSCSLPQTGILGHIDTMRITPIIRLTRILTYNSNTSITCSNSNNSSRNWHVMITNNCNNCFLGFHTAITRVAN